MSDTTSRYVPRDYRRTCDICGMLRNISQMHRQDELWVCTYDYGERVRTQLDRGNARQRPFTIKPVPHPKPWDHFYPNLLETDDAAVFNFLAQQVAAQCRYEYVQSGHAVATAIGDGIAALSWAGRYFYDLIQANEPSRSLLIPKAKELLNTIAVYLQTKQRGFVSGSTSTRANDIYYGGFLATGATKYVTNDTATAGLALLYAYRVLGTMAYLNGARAAASYLRNVQAIGSNATQHTSTDAAGLGRLYTGAVCSEVSTTLGVDPGAAFYSNHLFYPGGLLALEFWSELKTTDGDQSIGLTAVINGFDSIPAQLMSKSITDMRTCWETGITDSTGTLINGFSSTTPKELFNAYPAIKTGFSVVGTGMWEYFDGGSADGTQITSQNYSLALSSLYNYEGATSQVTGISDWLRTFTSNPTFETPADTSTSVLYQGTTGTYDPTVSIATLLQVRDQDTLAATTINASSLYDWGAFGLLSRLWASRYTGSFRTSRLDPLNTVQRYFDGNYNDGLTSDRIILRGLSGLSMQTGFAVELTGTSAGTISYPASSGSTTSATLPTTDLCLVLEGDKGVSTSGSLTTAWADQSGQAQNFTTTAGKEPSYNLDSLDGVPGVCYPDAQDARRLERSSNLHDTAGTAFTTGSSFTIVAVVRPKTGVSAGFSITGGCVLALHSSLSEFTALFDMEGGGNLYLEDAAWRLSGLQIQGPTTSASVYANQPTVIRWKVSWPSLSVQVNTGGYLALSPSGTLSAIDGNAGAAVGNNMTIGGGSFNNYPFQGNIFAIYMWGKATSGVEDTQANQYIGAKFPTTGFPTLSIGVVNDAVRAAQFGRSFREARS